MKHVISTAYFQCSSLVLRSLCSLSATVLILSGTAVAQNGKEEQQADVKPETVQSFLPGTLVDWTVKIDKNKVVLGWTTTIEANALHFTIEKSFNGTDYSDAGLLLAAGNSNSRKQYAFTEKLSNNASKNIYYRLKLVDLNANVKYSDVRSVRAGAQEEVKLEIYPNPAVNELKLSVAASWINQQLVVQVYNMNGILVKTKINDNAKETELLPVSDLAKGLYFVKVSNGSSSSVLRFVKN